MNIFDSAYPLEILIKVLPGWRNICRPTWLRIKKRANVLINCSSPAIFGYAFAGVHKFDPGQHPISASHYRLFRMRAFAPWNEAHWQNPRFNKLLLQARAKLNDTFRAEQYREICQIASDDGGSIIPFFANFVYARTKKVAHGPSLAASWEIDGCRGSHRPHTRTDTLIFFI
jgi:hypothetical protein